MLAEVIAPFNEAAALLQATEFRRAETSAEWQGLKKLAHTRDDGKLVGSPQRSPRIRELSAFDPRTAMTDAGFDFVSTSDGNGSLVRRILQHLRPGRSGIE